MDQLALGFDVGSSGWAGPREFRVGARTLRVSECFDTYWRFAAERQRIFHHRAAGKPHPWTQDPILSRHKFTNVYRAADRVSQYLISEVIYNGPQDTEELVFRVLLFKLFNRVEIWQLLTDRLGAPPRWADYDYATYQNILGEPRKHGNHLRLVESAITNGLPDALAGTTDLRTVYDALVALPSLGPFLAYQYAIDLACSPMVGADETQFVIPGPGALDGIS